MTLRVILQSAAIALLAVAPVSFAQAQQDDKSTPAAVDDRPPGTGHHEVPGDPYIPVPPSEQITSPALVWICDGYASVQVNVNASGQNIVGDAANEPSIAVDPTNPNRMAIGWRQFDTISSNFRQAGYGYSTDGGQSWTFPGKVEPGVYRSDPVLNYDLQGNFYYLSLTRDPPQSNFHCHLFKSTDGGMTWGPQVYAYGGDKEWMAIDRTGGIGQGNIYSTWNKSYSSCNGQFTRSTDGGQSFVGCVDVSGRPYWGTMAVGPDGELYIAGNGFVVAKSTNVQDPAKTPTQWTFTSRSVSLGGSLKFGGGPNPGGLLGQAYVAVDCSNGPTRGNVYLLGSVDPSGADPMDVGFARSTDGGLSWSASKRINDDAGTSAWQWFGAMSVAPNGRIDVTWNDSRDNPGSYDSRLYYSYSEDGGDTWSPNVALTPSFDPHLGWPNQNKLGDYNDMISEDAGVHLAYAATFNGEQDVYYLWIPGPWLLGDMNCDGVVNFDDIDPFVLALGGQAAYQAQYPNCNWLNADCNKDGTVNFDDIDPFVALLAP